MGFKASMCLQPLLHPIQDVGPAADSRPIVRQLLFAAEEQSANVEVVFTGILVWPTWCGLLCSSVCAQCCQAPWKDVIEDESEQSQIQNRVGCQYHKESCLLFDVHKVLLTVMHFCGAIFANPALPINQ